MFRKAQASMEFLMTYGWALLVVLGVISALAYFGVLTPANLLPEKCTFPVSLSCENHVVFNSDDDDEDYIGLIIQNGAGRDILLRGITATGEALDGICATNYPISSSSQCPAHTADLGNTTGCKDPQERNGSILRNGNRAEITLTHHTGNCTYQDKGRPKERYSVNIYYSWLDSASILKVESGELFSRVSTIE